MMPMIADSYIVIDCLRFHAFHGVEAQESLTGNDYEVSLRLKVDVSRAALTDDVADTVNYGEVYKVVAREMETRGKLLESVAYRIGQSILSKWSCIESLDVALTKLNPPMRADCKGAGVELHLINDKTER